MSGGVLHHGTHEEDGPVTREVLASPRTNPALRRAGHPSPNAPCVGRGMRGRLRTSSCIEVGRRQGEPKSRLTEVRKSEGCIRALTPGNLLALGPGRAKAARVNKIFRREPCLMHRHQEACHCDC